VSLRELQVHHSNAPFAAKLFLVFEQMRFGKDHVLLDFRDEDVALVLHEALEVVLGPSQVLQLVDLDGPDLDVDLVPGDGLQDVPLGPLDVQREKVHRRVAHRLEDAVDGQASDVALEHVHLVFAHLGPAQNNLILQPTARPSIDKLNFLWFLLCGQTSVEQNRVSVFLSSKMQNLPRSAQSAILSIVAFFQTKLCWTILLHPRLHIR